MRYQKRSVLKRAGVGIGGVFLGLTAFLLASCNNVATTDQVGEDQTTVTTEDVSENTSELIGQQVTVRNLVEETVGESGFIIEARDGEPILVLNTTGVPFELPDPNVPVQVTGEVQSLVAADIEGEYGLELEDELYADYEGQAAIIAQSLALAPNPENLYENYATYLDQQIAVEGDIRKLEETDNAFALFEEGWIDDVGVLVVGLDRNPAGGSIDAVEEGDNVTVTGVARQPTAELLQEYNVGWDDSEIQEFLSRYTERPIIVADGIYPSAVDPAPGN